MSTCCCFGYTFRSKKIVGDTEIESGIAKSHTHTYTCFRESMGNGSLGK
jgi:hypothetical protein